MRIKEFQVFSSWWLAYGRWESEESEKPFMNFELRIMNSK